jgi:hypothetical protein
MNIINAGNPSANNMIIRQVMQKKRQSSATIFDKLNKRTAKLTAKNPLNNVLTNDQLFRYYIQEVEPKLSQSNDNFSGLPNTTPPDNSIKDTTEKSYGDAGFSANGVQGMLNSNDITQMTPIPPSAPYIERPAQTDYFTQYMNLPSEDEADFIYQILFNEGPTAFSEFVGQIVNNANSDPARPPNEKDITYGEVSAGLMRTMKRWSVDYRNSDQFEINDVLYDMISQLQNDAAQQPPLDLSHLKGPRVPTQVEAEAEALGFAPENVEAGAVDTRIQIYGGDIRFSPQHLPGVSKLSKPEPVQLFDFSQRNVAAGSIPSVSSALVPKDVAVQGGVEKKKRAPRGSQSVSTDPRRSARTQLDTILPQISNLPEPTFTDNFEDLFGT